MLVLTRRRRRRISGRASHVARLRAEFDTGADYDLRECPPGDLDPHAVSSIFKAYLRERECGFSVGSLVLLGHARCDRSAIVSTAVPSGLQAPLGSTHS
jgi:hypothetical protein